MQACTIKVGILDLGISGVDEGCEHLTVAPVDHVTRYFPNEESMQTTFIGIRNLIANRPWIIITNQPPIPLVKHCILRLRLLMPIRGHPPQLIHNIKVLRTTLIQMIINIIRTSMELLHPRRLLKRSSVERQPNVHLAHGNAQLCVIIHTAMGAPASTLVRPPLIEHWCIHAGQRIPRPVHIVAHEVELGEVPRDFGHLDLFDLVGTAGEGGGEAVRPSAYGAEGIEGFAYCLEEEGEVHGVGGRAGVVFVAWILPVDVDSIKTISLDQPNALVRKISPPIPTRRNPRKVIAQSPPPNARHDLHAHPVRQVHQSLFQIVMRAIAIRAGIGSVPAAKVIRVGSAINLSGRVVNVRSH
mmetsp:Transcript_19099/g.41358  ORF Transcript_19099/g.41358 Transcript_19099/m.41358 type:complete len:356 (-) Transcript_19099:1063-2130(-)